MAGGSRPAWDGSGRRCWPRRAAGCDQVWSPMTSPARITAREVAASAADLLADLEERGVDAVVVEHREHLRGVDRRAVVERERDHPPRRRSVEALRRARRGAAVERERVDAPAGPAAVGDAVAAQLARRRPGPSRCSWPTSRPARGAGRCGVGERHLRPAAGCAATRAGTKLRPRPARCEREPVERVAAAARRSGTRARPWPGGRGGRGRRRRCGRPVPGELRERERPVHAGT